MKDKKYNCIDFEGADQVGKGDAVKNFSRYTSVLGLHSCIIAFPYYCTPIGYVIRDTLLNGFPKEIKKDKEVEIKMALFALNRIEILNCIEQNEMFDLYIFDRGPFSNALTIAYHLFATPGEISRKNRLVNDALHLDLYFRETLNIDNCVVCLRYKDVEWRKERKNDGGDLYERREVQDISGEVYDIFENEIGEGWKNVVTKDKNGWRSREDIRDECVEFAINRGVLPKSAITNKIVEPYYLSINEIEKYLYPNSDVSEYLKRSWLNAVAKNDKKEVYLLSGQIAKAFTSTTGPLIWGSDKIVGQVKNILNSFPEILNILTIRYGKSFVYKFLDSLEQMKKKEKAYLLLSRLEEMFPNAQTELKNWSTPFQFLVCIILSAQTTDKQVNKVTDKLFQIYPDGYTMSLASVKDIEGHISSINYYHTKAKNIKKMSEIIVKDYNGEVPTSLEALLKLPGVGYKTANVFLNDLYQSNQGIAVDTHVKKTALKYGLTKNTDPNKIAKDLERIYDREDWYKINRYFVLYGRYNFNIDLLNEGRVNKEEDYISS